MLFRPSFCANCGEKIERAEWFIWTSRRFCQVCESEFKGVDLIPRVLVISGVLAAIFGFGTYLGSGTSKSELHVSKQKRNNAVQSPRPAIDSRDSSIDSKIQEVNASLSDKWVQPQSSSPNGNSSSLQAAKPEKRVEEPIHFCRAETKKGTPCSRRVKGNVRCFQHVGMLAMTSPPKLK